MVEQLFRGGLKMKINLIIAAALVGFSSMGHATTTGFKTVSVEAPCPYLKKQQTLLGATRATKGQATPGVNKPAHGSGGIDNG